MQTQTLETLIERQRAEIQNWRSNADEIGEQIADQVWDALERELEDLTSDGLLWDLSETLQMGLTTALALNFDEACERSITRRLEAHSAALLAADPDWNYDVGRTSLDHLRKSLRIRQHFTPRFERLFEQAKPGVLSLLGRAFVSDEDYVLKHMERDSQRDAARLRSVFYTARREIAREIAQLGSDLLRRACHSYLEALATHALRPSSPSHTCGAKA